VLDPRQKNGSKSASGLRPTDSRENEVIIKDNLPKEVPPKGKRTVRANRWGNTNAYIGGRFWKTIGPTYAVGTDEAVERFLNGEDD
jgi:hypothetical protein